MPLLFVTTIAPAGIDFWVEDSVPGAPTDVTPRIGSLCMNATSGAVHLYVKTTSTAWAEIPFMISLTTGVLGTPQLLPVTLPAGNGTTAVTLPVRAAGWRVVDFWIASGGAGAGTVQVQRGSDNAVITDALVPGATPAITRAAALTTANNLIASSGVVNFVRAGGFTACAGWAVIIPA